MTNIIILVHGTWGKDEKGWYQNLDAPDCFTNNLKRSLNGDLSNSIFIPFEWSGDNTHIEREVAGKNLAEKLIELRNKYKDSKFHFIAHSHGGNVILKALEIYINKLKRHTIEPFSHIKNEVELCEAVIGYFTSDINDNILKKDEKLKNIIDEIINIKNKQKELSGTLLVKIKEVFGQGILLSPHPLLLVTYPLKNKITDAFEQLCTHEEHHGLKNVITLGTPYYFKKWYLSKTSLILDRVIHYLFYISILYFGVLFYGGIINLLFSTSWSIYNPLSWHWFIQSVMTFSAIVILFTTSLIETRVKDTNVYFSPTIVNNFLKKLERQFLCRSLIIHADYFDEAYLGLSLYPIIKPTLNNNLSKINSVKWWGFQWEKQRTGVIRESISGSIRLFFRNLNKFFFSILMLPIFPVRLIVSKMANLYLKKRVDLSIQTSSFGLPEGEFSESTITVRNVPKLDFLNSYQLDVSEYVKDISDGDCKNNGNKKDNFSFLYNDKELQSRYKNSKIAKHIVTNLNDEDKKRILMLEERGKEIFGVTGLRHSMYYKNDNVINAICRFLEGNNVPGAKPVINN